ncbi:hypothetical protein M404DRAFT_23716 [Pisolithus tinctorius Marx 270]|uniref:Chromo domain-containing protein n=1 Tax=Pisolithus tinctorius Marx 270 TaxID=870435 RepID=A0A0C3KCA0_PISTI|nr:hypothetical protein M404DRAFT_23709 [Pisolithus tinctorius Marx 270]KIO07265.1 hypothetical protein M404DRAFT_23716 [Pisolithus tinctorius Marx 270]
MSITQQCYQGPADAKCIPLPEFEVGEQAYVKAKYFCSTHPSEKLSKNSLTLCAQSIQSSMSHNWKPQWLTPSPNPFPNQQQPPPLPVDVNGDLEYKVLEILDSKVDHCHCHCQLLYLVCWAGYENTDEETSWLLTTELDHASNIISAFHECYLHKPGPYQPPP